VSAEEEGCDDQVVDPAEDQAEDPACEDPDLEEAGMLGEKKTKYYPMQSEMNILLPAGNFLGQASYPEGSSEVNFSENPHLIA